jgi:hypothetical protein
MNMIKLTEIKISKIVVGADAVKSAPDQSILGGNGFCYEIEFDSPKTFDEIAKSWGRNVDTIVRSFSHLVTSDGTELSLFNLIEKLYFKDNASREVAPTDDSVTEWDRSKLRLDGTPIFRQRDSKSESESCQSFYVKRDFIYRTWWSVTFKRAS